MLGFCFRFYMACVQRSEHHAKMAQGSFPRGVLAGLLNHDDGAGGGRGVRGSNRKPRPRCLPARPES